MHKCFKCGTQFEGTFCPECGTQWQEDKRCPQCGAMLAGSAKFCNNCGYSFVKTEAKKPAAAKEPNKVGIFFKKVWTWVKSHLKIVIPTACALVAVIVVCSLIPTFILMGVNGTYYAYTFDGDGEMVLNEKDFVKLSAGKWTDGDGNEGTYFRSGKNVTLKYHDKAAEDFGDIFGAEVPTELTLSATVENGLLTVTNGMQEEIYATEKHEHIYGEWETVSGTLCETESTQTHRCACKATEVRTVPPWHTYDKNYECRFCGKKAVPTEGLKIEVSDYGEGKYGIVKGIGSASGEVIIPQKYNGKPITEIDERAFYGCDGLTSVTIPNSVTIIKPYAFSGCASLATIKFAGTQSEWRAISKGERWINDTSHYNVYCTDGKYDSSHGGGNGGPFMMSVGAPYLIIGIAIAVIAAVGITTVVVIVVRRKKKNETNKLK